MSAVAPKIQMKNLGDLCSIKTGKKDVNQGSENGRYPFYTCAQEIHRSEESSFDGTAILVAGNGFFNVKFHREGKFEVYQRTYVLQDFQIEPKYLYHYIDYALDDITKNNRGSTIRYIRLGDLKDYVINFPPEIEEQRRIVARIEAIFSRLDAGVAALKQAKAQLQRYRQSVLAAAVTGELTKAWREQNPDVEHNAEQFDLFGTALPKGWMCPKLIEVISEGPRNGFSPQCGSSGHGSNVLKLSATSSCRMLLNENTVKISIEPVDPDSHAWLQPDDVLIQRANSLELLGSTAIYEGPEKRYVYPDLMMRVRVAEPSTRKLITIYLNSLPARNYFQRNATGVAGNMPKINGATLKALPVPFPPLAEQHQVVAEVEARTTAIDHLEVELVRQIKRSNRLRQSTLVSAFKGEI